MPPTVAEQHDIDQQIEPARWALGRVADTAFQAGRGLSLADATTEALAVGSAPWHQTVERSVVGLSPRERQVAILVGHGYSNRHIAETLIVSEATVATHVRNSLSKLELSTRAQLAVWASKQGLLGELPSGAYSRPDDKSSPPIHRLEDGV